VVVWPGILKAGFFSLASHYILLMHTALLPVTDKNNEGSMEP